MNEEIKCCENQIKDYKSAFKCFKKRFLIDRKSIFRCDAKDDVLTDGGITYLTDHFINNGYTGNTKSFEKFCHQLTGKKYQGYTQPTTWEAGQKEAIEILATAVWLWKLAPINTNKLSRINAVNEIYALAFDKLTDSTGNPFFSDNIKGFASPGMRYNMNKANELAYIILFFEKCLEKNKSDSIEVNCLFDDGKVTIRTTSEYSYTDKSKRTLPEMPVKQNNSKDSTESVAIYNALLHLLNSNDFEPIISSNHKKMIVNAFEDKFSDCNSEPETIDKKLKSIKEKLGCKSFYDPVIYEQWNPSILPAKNVIYYGAPGTGKTYELIKLIKEKAKVQDGICPEKYYKVVQFHPSYNYEDFIDGVKPVKSDSNNGTIQLELQDGVFKKMCQEAFTELKRFNELSEENKKDDEAKKFYFIADEINRAELSRVFGELLVCLEEDKRLKFVDGKLEGLLVQTQNASLWKEIHAVVTLDNTNCANGLYFGVPENIYFLGTMNDIDKSIDSFDLALRRRFKWVHKGCNYDVVANYLLEKGVNDDDISGYINDGKNKSQKGRCVLLNEYISEKIGLGKAYELGHSYFMRLNIYQNGNISKDAYGNLFDFEIAPLVTEYLRAEFDTKGIETHIKKMRALFVNGDENNEIVDGDDNNG